MAGIFIILCKVFWAGDRFLIGPIVAYSSLYSTLFTIGITAFLVTIPFLFFVYKDFSKLEFLDWLKIIFIGLGVGGLYTNLLFVSYAQLQQTNTDDLILMMHFIQPAFLFVTAAIMVGNMVRITTFVAFITAFFGAYLLCFGFTSPVIFGQQILMIIIGGALLRTASTVFAKQLLVKISPFTLTYLRIFVSFLIILVIVSIFENKTIEDLFTILETQMTIGPVHTHILMALLFEGIGSFTLGVLFYYSALKKLRLTQVPVFEYSYIVFVSIYHSASYGYYLAPATILGMMLVGIAITLQLSTNIYLHSKANHENTSRRR